MASSVASRLFDEKQKQIEDDEVLLGLRESTGETMNYGC